MSYGVRNTIILLIVLITFIGAGWSYIYFYQEPQLEELQANVEEKRQELNQKQEIADQYPRLKNQYDEATRFFNNYNKALYGSSNEDSVFDFLNNVNSGSAYTNFTFSFTDSTQMDQYGILTMNVSGQAYYRNFINFIRQIERNKPLNKIQQLTISPIDQLGSYSEVNYSFTLESYYDRVKLLGDADWQITNNLVGSVYNPFYPLIRSVKENENNLVNVQQSSLVAVSTDQVFLIDQGGRMKKLSPGDEVYLGTLTAINVNEGSASF
jgi:Tfp pilus assembly protein PilO